MKHTLVKLASIFLLIVFSFASEETNTTLDTNTSVNLPKQKSIFLSYEEVPKKVFVGEVFPIKVKAIISNSNFEDIQNDFSDFDANKTIIINPDAKWQWFSDNIFYNTYYIKTKSTNAKLPKITFNLLQNGQVIDSETLENAKTSIIKLNGDKYFSKVIASSLKVNKYKTTYFNDKSYIVVLDLEAKYSNLNDFQLDWVQRDGIDSAQDNLPFYKIFYYAIIPDYQKNFIFTYFNTTTNDFEKINIPIIVDEDKVSTQIGLNPKESSLQIYKNALYGIVILTLFILFLRRKKLIYILLISIMLVFVFYDKTPINDVKIKTDTQVRILPTKNSTIFYVIDRPMYAEKLARKNEYIKILLPNKKIGWIKEDSVIEN